MNPVTILLFLVTLMQPMTARGQSRPTVDDLQQSGSDRTNLLRNQEARAADRLEPAGDARHRVAAKLSRFKKASPYLKAVGYTAEEMLGIVKEFRESDPATRPQQDSPGSAEPAAARRLFSDVRRLDPRGVLFQPCSDDTHFSDTPLPTPDDSSCCPFPQFTCKKNMEYRTIDGSCNCESNPNMGRSFRALSRLIPAQYSNGISTPRTLSVSGSVLPSAREISVAIFQSMPSKINNVLTQMHFSVGQLVDHDSDLVAISSLMKNDGSIINVECGTDGCQTAGPENRECFPITIKSNDPFYTNANCLIFVRSQAFLKDNCEIGPREQPNSLTSWLDASMLYGSTEEELEKLRDNDNSRGKMKTTKNPGKCKKPLLPQFNDPACRGTNNNIRCFLAGDERVNEQVGLTAMHTILVRWHNYIEGELFNVLPMGNGEKYFQETRKLVIALWQNIIYHEYLPLTIGQKNMDKHGLTLKDACFTGYNCKKYNADVPNGFATAAFRFGHSQIGNNLWLSNPQYTQKNPIPFSSVMFRPNLIYQPDLPGDATTCGPDAIILGLCSNQADTVDRFFTHQLTRHLFTETPSGGPGLDLPALNIQRGRDHGIPVYTRWRKFCKLSVPTSIDNMVDIPAAARNNFKQVYDHVEDIDLFAAGIAENVVEGGTVGPTFACIIANRFKTAKFADKFWFERCDTKGTYTKEQIDEIKKYTFGRLICDTLENVLTIQKFPMMVSLSQATQKLGKSEQAVKKMFPLYNESKNNRVICKDLREIDFTLFGPGGGGGLGPDGLCRGKGPCLIRPPGTGTPIFTFGKRRKGKGKKRKGKGRKGKGKKKNQPGK